MTIDSKALDEAIEFDLPKMGYGTAEYKRHLRAVIRAAQECQGLHKAVRMLSKKCSGRARDQQQLRAEIDSLRKQLPEVVTVDDVYTVLQPYFDAEYIGQSLPKLTLQGILRMYPNGIVIKE